MAKTPLSILPDGEQNEPGQDLQNKHWFDAVLESPVFAGVLALLALSIGFSPRASTSATWVCLALAWLLLARTVYTLENIRTRPRFERLKVTGIVSTGSLVAFTVFGLWLMQPLKSAINARVNSESPAVAISQPSPYALATTPRPEKRGTPLSSPSVAANSPSPTANTTPSHSAPTSSSPLTLGGLNSGPAQSFPSDSLPSFSGLEAVANMGFVHCEVLQEIIHIQGGQLRAQPYDVTSRYISNAEVTLRNIKTDKKYTGRTDIFGSVKILVTYGSYQLTVQAEGYTYGGYREAFFLSSVEVREHSLNYERIYMRKIESASPTPKE